MASLIESHAQQYAILTADITAKIGKLATHADKKSIIQEIERHVEEAQELLEQMELESREADPAVRPRLRTQLDSYRAELKRLTQEFTKVRSTQFEDGFYSQDDIYSNNVSVTEEQKRSLLDNSERLERTGKQLTTGYRMILETEEIGSQVLQDLNSQRETIQRSRNRLRETNAELGLSSRLISGMLRRSWIHRFILYGVAVVFVVTIVVVISLVVMRHTN